MVLLLVFFRLNWPCCCWVHYNGGFRFWPDSWRPSPWLTAYVVYALGRADDQGYRIDRAMMRRALEYLQTVLRREDVDWEYPYNKNVQLTTKAFILYALVVWDEYDHGYLSKLFEKRDQMSLFGKTLLLKAADEYGNSYYVQELRRILLNKIKMAPTTAHFEEHDDAGMSWIWHSNVRTTALVLQAFLETGGEFPPSCARVTASAMPPTAGATCSGSGFPGAASRFSAW